MKNEYFTDDFVFKRGYFTRKASALFSFGIFLLVAGYVVNKKHMLSNESPMLITYSNTMPLLSTITGLLVSTQYLYNF